MLDVYEWHGQSFVGDADSPDSQYDIFFYEYLTADNGARVIDGETQADGYLNGFVLGYTPDVLPNLPSFHSYQYVWLDSSPTLCIAVLFSAEDVTRDRQNTMDINGTVVAVAIEQDSFIPEAADCAAHAQTDNKILRYCPLQNSIWLFLTNNLWIANSES